MVRKFRHILKVFKLYEGLRIYGYMSAVARIQKISREQKGFKINNFETIGNIERQTDGLRKIRKVEILSLQLLLLKSKKILFYLETNIFNDTIY